MLKQVVSLPERGILRILVIEFGSDDPYSEMTSNGVEFSGEVSSG